MNNNYFTGTTSTQIQNYEIEHRQVAKEAAQDGFVLLKNDNSFLPLEENSKVALYGAGASKTIKGGTGSGDVNSRESVSIYEGMKNAGFEITNEDWIEEYDDIYLKARYDWRDVLIEKYAKENNPAMMFNIYTSTPFFAPSGTLPKQADCDTAIYVLSRIAGENKDTCAVKGDYYLSDEEDKFLETVCSLYKKVVVILNTGAPVDLSFMDRYKNIASLLHISQPGMEGGNAVAEMLKGDVSPSGKLTDTWAINYEDYPNSKTFSHNNGDVKNEEYKEGIYVGYRYFDSFNKKVRYGFGFGLSYTKFMLCHTNLNKKKNRFIVSSKVVNMGCNYFGREVVQVYVSCPSVKLDKEFRRLVGFKKTKSIEPGGTDVVSIDFGLEQLASFSEERSAWILEEGIYGVFIGNSLESSVAIGSLNLDKELILSETERVCPVEKPFDEIESPKKQVEELRAKVLLKLKGLTSLTIEESDATSEKIEYGKYDERVDEDVLSFVDKLSDDQLINLSIGEMGQDEGSNLGSAGILVPGSAAQTSSCAVDMNLPSMILADGPAGLRLTKEYIVKDGNVIKPPFAASIENGFLLMEKQEEIEGERWYQYCTAIPVGTLLAQTWDPDALKRVGIAIADEMKRFKITLWLAPGMNIHRNPLCGRNFEYYSEDPFLVGKIAGAITDGVQSVAGCGTTIKHFALNNQEDNRMASNSIINERAMREIYFKGFEIAVKESQPLSVMTSYNLINGIHAANNFDLCTKVLRDEWGFDGVIMTDWTTTNIGPDCTASGCVAAGNELVMPGFKSDFDDIKRALEDGSITRSDLKRNISHLVSVIKRANPDWNL